ncbi:hypothetical protein M9194_00175 [Vibrio sp. S4M6]|uniref:hypothetical protein n=1 Tax=Vibrio sinus TaxID=2946865 RepID=UPI00202A7531|nr:hypothetical protein [Vibrio sinus]MCL9779847.1 hypothetical protein [Vibrio sinus]
MFNKAKVIARVVVSSACFIPLAANANNFSYNFFELSTAVSPDSSGIEFSNQITDNAHFIARASTQFDKDHDLAGGIGFNGPLNQFADIYGQLLIHQIKYTQEAGGESEVEGEMNVGLRVWISDQFEATGRIGRLDDRSVFYGGVRFHSTDQLSISAENRNNGIYGPQLTMTVRFQF